MPRFISTGLAGFLLALVMPGAADAGVVTIVNGFEKPLDPTTNTLFPNDQITGFVWRFEVEGRRAVKKGEPAVAKVLKTGDGKHSGPFDPKNKPPDSDPQFKPPATTILQGNVVVDPNTGARRPDTIELKH